MDAGSRRGYDQELDGFVEAVVEGDHVAGDFDVGAGGELEERAGLAGAGIEAAEHGPGDLGEAFVAAGGGGVEGLGGRGPWHVDFAGAGFLLDRYRLKLGAAAGGGAG